MFPLKPVQNRPQDTTDDYTGPGSYASGIESSRDRILDSGGVSHLNKWERKHLSKKVARLLRSSTLTSSNKKFQDVSRHFSKVRDGQSPSHSVLAIGEAIIN